MIHHGLSVNVTCYLTTKMPTVLILQLADILKVSINIILFSPTLSQSNKEMKLSKYKEAKWVNFQFETKRKLILNQYFITASPARLTSSQETWSSSQLGTTRDALT